MLRRFRCVQIFLKQHSDLGACCTLSFSAAGCECIHLTRVHVHCCTGILLIFAHARTRMMPCNGAKQIKTKCPCTCNHGKEIQHAHFMPIVGVGKRGVINWSMVTCKNATLVRNYLEVYWPCADGFSAVNAIGTQLRGPIKSGLTRWRLAVLNITMDAAAEVGRNPVCKHQIQPEYGDEQADAGRDCRTRLARPNSQARTRTGKYSFSLFSWPRAGLVTLPG